MTTVWDNKCLPVAVQQFWDYLKSYNLHQWWKVIYIYSSTILKHNFELHVLYLSISILCHFLPLLHLRGKSCTLYSTTALVTFQITSFIPFLSSENHKD